MLYLPSGLLVITCDNEETSTNHVKHFKCHVHGLHTRPVWAYKCLHSTLYACLVKELRQQEKYLYQIIHPCPEAKAKRIFFSVHEDDGCESVQPFRGLVHRERCVPPGHCYHPDHHPEIRRSSSQE